MVKDMVALANLVREKNHQAALDLALQIHPRMQDNPYLLRLISGLYSGLAYDGKHSKEGWELEAEGIKWGERAVQVAPEIGWLHAELGWDCALHLDHEHAHQSFRKALELDPCCYIALQGLVYLWRTPENEGWITREELISFLKRGIELEHREPVMIHRLVQELQAMGRHEEARAYAARGLMLIRPLKSGAISEFEKILLEDDFDDKPSL